jgi:hypothetical protein
VVVLTLLFAASVVGSPLASAVGTITQTSPTSGSVNTAGSTTFTTALATSGAAGPVFYTLNAASGPPGLTVDSSGVISTTGPLSNTGSP